MSVIISNILDLLVWLKEKGVAIRDLKPDNLFVVGDSAKSSLFLGDLEQSSLGLIDFETAVEFKISSEDINGGILAQPLLGGTPSYATPSHLYPNELLSNMLNSDLSRILHLQDWHAAVAMIYYVITGECLFEKTRKIMPRIKYMVKKCIKEKLPLAEAFKKGSRIYWNSAMNELKEKLHEKEDMLKSVEIVITRDIKDIFWQYLLEERENTKKRIRKYIVSQIIFNNNKSRKSLFQSPVEEIRRYKMKWEKGVGVPQTSPEIRKQIIRFLKRLEELKLQLEKQKRLINLFEPSVPTLSAYELLETMFNIVFKTMYKPEWGRLSESYIYDGEEPAEETSQGNTILYEETIMYEATGS